MFRNHIMPGSWHRQDTGSQSTSALPTATLAFAEQYPHSLPQSSQRYQYSGYQVSNANAAVDPPNTGASHASLSSRQAWPFGEQELHNPDIHTSFTDPMPSSSSYYAQQSAQHLVAYPESSQRTLLPETAFSAGYSIPYHQGAMAFTTDMTSAGAHGNAAEIGVESTHSVRHRGRLEHGEAERRSVYALHNQFLNARADFERAESNRMLPQSNQNLHTLVGNSHSSSMHPILHVLPIISHSSTAQSVFSEPATLSDAQSPRLPSYIPSLRRNSMESVYDPMSPSSVPPLVYDGETGEEFDDDSESNPPSTSSEHSRSSFHGASAGTEHFRMKINVPNDWPRSSFDTDYTSMGSAQEFDRATMESARSPKRSFEADLSSETASGPSTSERSKPSQKKSKMHECTVCHKMFPRPSGLATHMNSHSGAKPYKCPIPTCTKSFAVRSNAKRHLRTHGIFPTSDHANSSPSQFTVGFDTPMVSEVHEVGKLPSKLRWVPQSLATRTNVDYLRDPPSDSDEEYPSYPLLSVPLPPVTPSSPTWNPDDRYEERDSYGETDTSPYIPSQWRALPGPAIVSSNNF